MGLPKRYKYRLEALLVVKERNKKAAEAELSHAKKQLEEEKQTLKRLEEEKKGIIAAKLNARLKMSQHMTSGETRVFDSSIHLNYLEKLQDDLTNKDQEIKLQHEKIERAEERVKTAKKDFIQASKELQTMEKHKEMWVKKVMKTLDAKEQKEMNELGNAIFQIRKMASSNK
ncbi:MAG: hypothetical protein HQM15_10140 [Deltaproteobacteria bacterium]|nr:hypothetical protein [Deltaproteobacteria bacterium]